MRHSLYREKHRLIFINSLQTPTQSNSIYPATMLRLLIWRWFHSDSSHCWDQSMREWQLLEMPMTSPNPAKENFSRCSPIPVQRQKHFAISRSPSGGSEIDRNQFSVTWGKIVRNLPASGLSVFSDGIVFSSMPPLGNFLPKIKHNLWLLLHYTLVATYTWIQ